MDVYHKAEFSRRFVLLGAGAAFAAAPSIVRANGSLSGFFDVTKFGAKGDGKTIDSPAINAAIAEAVKAGGGTVVVPKGHYLSFSIRLYDNITLLLSEGALIEAANPDVHGHHYDLPEGVYDEQFQDYGVSHFRNSLIYGLEATNVAVIGKGMIYGRGLDREGPAPRWHGIKGFVSASSRGLDPHAARLADPREAAYEGRAPHAVAFKSCRNIVVKDFTILQGGHFALFFMGCEGIKAENLLLDTDRDGIDLDCCKGAEIINCRVNTPKDDGIVMKSSFAYEKPVFCEDVVVKGCHTSGYLMGSVVAGNPQPSPYMGPDDVGPFGRLKLGTDSVAGFRNIVYEDCLCEHGRGIQMGAIDGGVLEDVRFENIRLKDTVNHPFFVRLSARNRAPKTAGIASVRRVVIKDIEATGVHGLYTSGIVGIPEKRIEDVEISNIRIVSQGGGTAADAAREIPERRKSSLEPSFMGTLPAHGLYIRHANNVRVKNVSFEVERPDQRPAIAIDSADGVTVEGLRSPQAVDRAVVSVRAKNVRVSGVVQG